MGNLLYKESLSAIAIALTLVAFVPYIRAIANGTSQARRLKASGSILSLGKNKSSLSHPQIPPTFGWTS